jgi:hypothetical protein
MDSALGEKKGRPPLKDKLENKKRHRPYLVQKRSWINREKRGIPAPRFFALLTIELF